MEHASLLLQGVNLMIFGMGFVFVFLTVLVVLTSIMSKVVGTIYGGRVKTDIEQHKPSIESNNKHLLTVISTAIHHYRTRHKH